MQHGHHPLPSQHLSTPVSQQLDSQSHLINDPTPHSSSRRSIPSPPQTQQYHQPHYQTYPTPTLYMHTPPPTHPPYYSYPPPPSISTQHNPDHIHQYPHPPPTILPPPSADQIPYPDNHNTYHAFPPPPAPQASPARPHIFANETTHHPSHSLPPSQSTPGNPPKPPDTLKPFTSLPPLRDPPSHVTNQSYYSVLQRVQNINPVMQPSRSVLPSLPYHPPQYISPNIPSQNIQQQQQQQQQRVQDATHFYNNPYHHNIQTRIPSEQHYQRTPANSLQWQPHLAPAGQVPSTPDAAAGDDTYAFPSYYVGPDGVTRYISQQPAPRKKRLQWTPDLHAKFVKAVEEFGVETAVPKMLLQAMNVPGLTRENVASHLQKYREGIRKRKLEVERSQSGTKRGTKELEKSKMLVNVGRNDEVGDGENVEARADKDKSEREDSSKRLRDVEGETGGKINSKRQKSVSNTQEGEEAVKRSGLTDQEVESYARVRARVDEALQLQAFRDRQTSKEPDIT